MRISIIGSGWVGTLIGKEFAKENDVIFCDVNQKTLEKLQKEGFNATDDINKAVAETDVSFITVPTPSTKDGIDISIVKSVSAQLGKALKNKKTYHVVVVKSTVVPRTCGEIVRNIIESESGKKIGADVGLCMNPEFLTQISSSWSKSKENERSPRTEERIVVGESDKKAGDIIEKLYKPYNIPIFRVDLKTAEFVKYASNCCLASRVSFWNEMFLVCKDAGINSEKIAEIVTMDKRIGKYGSVHGLAYGGTCFPKDVRAFIAWAKKYRNPILTEAVEKINEEMKKTFGVRE